MVRTVARVLVFYSCFLISIAAIAESDPLPSWNPGAAKQAIFNFVSTVTAENGPNYVPLPERIIVFDSDGTLWVEKPMYVQERFVIDEIRSAAPQVIRTKSKHWVFDALRNNI